MKMVASAMMSEHQKHTEFLRQCILYDEGAERQNLAQEIARIQRNIRSVQRAACLMAMLAALVVAALGYGVILTNDYPYNTPRFIYTLVVALGVGSLVSFVAFMCLWMVYHWKLNLRREECRQMIITLMESRLSKQANAPSGQNRADKEDERRVHELVEKLQESLTGKIGQQVKP